MNLDLMHDSFQGNLKVTAGFFKTKVQQCLIRKLKKTKQRMGYSYCMMMETTIVPSRAG